jgi:hypothetical protein
MKLRDSVAERYQENLVSNEEMNGGFRIALKFENNYGVSFICHYGSYGNEIAVLKFDKNGNSHLCYDTEITDDVLGHLEYEEVFETIERIKNLKEDSK